MMSPDVIRFTKDSDYVNYVNNLLSKTCLSLSDQYIPLGQEFSGFSHETAAAQLQLHRLMNKFEVPSVDGSKERSAQSMRDMLFYDHNGLTRFNPALDHDLDGSVRQVLYDAKRTLREVISSYRFSVSNLELTSGETYVSARGDTSVYAKLRDVKQWTVTSDCFDLAARLFYNSPMLKAAVKHHFKKWFFAQFHRIIKKNDASPILGVCSSPKDAWARYNETISSVVFPSRDGSSKCRDFTPNEKFEVFKYKFRKLVTFVRGARLTTVPKNNSSDRVIECECWLNMLVQRTIAGSIRQMIKKHYGIDLQTSQNLHGLLISDTSNATIDWKNASNSVWLKAVNWMLEGSLLSKHLNLSRCGLVSHPEKVDELPHMFDGDCYWYKLNMLSPNGNGFTFEVLTLMLLAVGRELDNFCHVYGDDVIIDADVARCYIESVKYLGFEINETKTFLTGNFRESCGSFFAEGYIISYDLHYAEDIVDAVILTNKIGIMGNTTNSWMKDKWLSLHHELLDRCPSSLLRGFKFDGINHANLKILVPDLADGVLIHLRRLVKLRKKDLIWSRRHENAVIDHLDLILDLNYHPYMFQSYRYVSKRSKTYLDVYEDFELEKVGILLGWYFIWSGRVTPPPLRETVLTTQYRIAFQ